jgi:1,4-dihydroxy-2-naphthoate octaprenyltransferase
MHINDLRDYDTDLVHRKRALAPMFGRRGAAFALAAMDTLAFAVIAGAVLVRILPWPTLLVAIAIPQAVSQARLVLRGTEPGPLHIAWLNGVKLHMQFGVLMIAGLVSGYSAPMSLT